MCANTSSAKKREWLQIFAKLKRIWKDKTILKQTHTCKNKDYHDWLLNTRLNFCGFFYCWWELYLMIAIIQICLVLVVNFGLQSNRYKNVNMSLKSWAIERSRPFGLQCIISLSAAVRKDVISFFSRRHQRQCASQWRN